MIIDAHGHYTTAPAAHAQFRKALLETTGDSRRSAQVPPAVIGDDEIAESLQRAQLRLTRERGTDLTLFSPHAGGMGHHLGDETTSQIWATACNDLIARVCGLYPGNFAGVCQLPQSPGGDPRNLVPELRRCIEELGFVGCNLNPDPTGGYWTDPPLTDRWWYPLYEALVELDVPAMVHVTHSCNPNFHSTGAHYLVGDTTAFVQFMTSTLFRDFPTLRFVIPHGGGAVPYQWGRYRGLAARNGLSDLDEFVVGNIFFDTCVYDLRGMRLLTETVPRKNILFASEIMGAVKGDDPRTGQPFDDTKRYIDAIESLHDDDLELIFSGNVMAVYPRLASRLAGAKRDAALPANLGASHPAG